MIKFSCLHCGQEVIGADAYRGHQTHCPKCGKIVTIPMPQPISKMIRFFCSYCGQKVSVSDEHGGQQAPCPKCAKIVTIPVADNGTADPVVAKRNAPPPTSAAGQVKSPLQKLAVAACVLGVGGYMLHTCSRQREDRDDWVKGELLLQQRNLDCSLLPNDAPRNFYWTYRDPESPTHVAEQLAGLRQAQAGAKVLIQNGFNAKKIPYLTIPQLCAVFDADRSGDKGALADAVAACKRDL